MELPIQVAVRVYPCATEDPKFVQIIPITSTAIYSSPNHQNFYNHNSAEATNLNNIASGIIQIGGSNSNTTSFPITHSLPLKCSQSQIYHQTVYPLICLFLEGFDASVVTYGQKGTGKSYTLYGPGFDCVYGEGEQGIVQRCVREIFTQLSSTYRDRSFIINIGWVEICGDEIRDLLQAGSVTCNSISDVFHWMQIGMQNHRQNDSSKSTLSHNLFTITLEQQWVSSESLIQHRLSTASFSDLCGTERMYMTNNIDQHISVPKDLGLQALEKIVSNLADDGNLASNDNDNVNNNNLQYVQTTLTTLLKDSFGGRAQTLLILCISPLERDCNETIFNLQFSYKAQCVRNYVIMNTFSDNNTPISPDVVPEINSVVGGSDLHQADNFGLQFAASQWLKLVSNAEGLFSKLVNCKSLNESDKEQIEEWLFLKQECEDCLSSSEMNFRSTGKQLVPIQEAEEEPDEICSSDIEDTSIQQQNSDNESCDSESQRPDLIEKVDNLMDELKLKTDDLVIEKYQEFIESQPKAVMESNESFRPLLTASATTDDRRASSSLGGRRKSIQPGATLSSAEIAMLNRVATSSREKISTSSTKSNRHQQKQQQHDNNDDEMYLESSVEHNPLLGCGYNSPIEQIQKELRKIITDIEAKQRQIKELEHTITVKKRLLSDLSKNKVTRTTAEQRFKKKRDKLEANYEKTKRQLSEAVVNGKNKSKIEHLKTLTSHFEQRLQVLVSIQHIIATGESEKKAKKLEQSMQESKKQLENLEENLRKEKKCKEQLENELKSLKEKDNNNGKSAGNDSSGKNINEKGKNLKQMQARISHLDHVLKEKSQNLEQYEDGEAKESLRHEIRNLRRTRDHLVDQRCMLDRKLKKEKMLSHREERKLLECDEAIEAIDAAIEFKNELICGRKSIDTSDRIQREKGEQMLMQRLNKLSPEEMRTLLYKYFTKVIDLRDSSRKLEIQLMNMERARDAWEWRERVLTNAVRQARLEGERNAILLQRQHETKLALMLRHLANESVSSSNFSSDRFLNHHSGTVANAFNTSTAAAAVAAAGVSSPCSPPPSHSSDTDFDFDNIYKTSSKHFVKSSSKQQHHHSHHHHHTDLDICQLQPDAITKYKPLDKIKEKDRETKNKLFAKFQVLKFSSGGAGSTVTNYGSNNKKTTSSITSNSNEPLIPEENLKKLQLNSQSAATKVTRQKNKIIIHDSSSSRKN